MRTGSGLLALVGVVVAAGCGSGADEGLSAPDRDRVAVLGQGLAMAQGVVALTGGFLGNGDVLDPGVTTTENAQAIADEAERAASCVVATAVGGGVSVTFDPGCTVNGVAVSGAGTLTVQKPAADTIAVRVELANLTVGGLGPFTGTVTFTASPGAAGLAVTLDLDTASFSVTGPLTLTAREGSLTLDGALTATGGAAPDGVTASIVGVTFTPGACYPYAGSLTLAGGVALGFLTTTPADGEVAVTKGRFSGTAALPAYGACPPAAPAAPSP
ncbi:MAG TPA: hypothetical protein VGQ83_01310 [Polyangia bacterium]|jgi:hypothetical protein